jgi:hypothetical protein
VSIDELPADQFNVVVEDDMDHARLLWLANRIGEAKLRNSVAKYQARWPGSKPFVSTLLKWYRLKVPVAVYIPVRVPVYWLYLLCKRDGTEVKVGMTGDWPSRVFAWVPLYQDVSDIFDLDRSRAFLVGGSKVEVRRRETALKMEFARWRSRMGDRYHSAGYTEWFNGARLDDLAAMGSSFDDEKNLVMQSLRKALEIRASASFQSPARPHPPAGTREARNSDCSP